MIEHEYNIEQDFDDFDEPTIIEQILEKEDKKIKELNKTREVIDDIKADIRELRDNIDIGEAIAIYDVCLDIIDKHIGKEREE